MWSESNIVTDFRPPKGENLKKLEGYPWSLVSYNKKIVYQAHDHKCYPKEGKKEVPLQIKVKKVLLKAVT